MELIRRVWRTRSSPSLNLQIIILVWIRRAEKTLRSVTRFYRKAYASVKNENSLKRQDISIYRLPSLASFPFSVYQAAPSSSISFQILIPFHSFYHFTILQFYNLRIRIYQDQTTRVKTLCFQMKMRKTSVEELRRACQSFLQPNESKRINQMSFTRLHTRTKNLFKLSFRRNH